MQIYLTDKRIESLELRHVMLSLWMTSGPRHQVDKEQQQWLGDCPILPGVISPCGTALSNHAEQCHAFGANKVVS